MNVIDLREAARAVPFRSPRRPGMAVVVDTPDVRVVLFRLAPGQAVPAHRNASTVMISVLEGEGWLAGAEGERWCRAGEVVAYAPEERHSMRAGDAELLLAATIAPRPARTGDVAA